MATRKEIFDEMERMLGRVPSWMMTMPDPVLESDWNTMKAIELRDTNIPKMHKHLIGVGVAAANSCMHTSLWHGMMAMAFGATDTQIDEALLMARITSGWSAYLEGSMVNMEDFTREATEIGQYVRDQQAKKAA
ncbi:MAG: carboxymuconolactone decarboxylase family protein [Actinobacteria bacterium]|nr:carboxymuconolactone decarboxylase family protein [Actinomycetota bacterium]